MVQRGKNVNVFLIDGRATGRIKCTLANWTGVAYKIPRTDIERSEDIELLNKSGVYFLFGTDDEDVSPSVYIGQARARKNGKGPLQRLGEHRRDRAKDYWTEAIILTTRDREETLGATELSYLEHTFTVKAKEAGRYTVRNENEPSRGQVTEEKESEMEDFIDYAELLLGILGHDVLTPLTKTSGNHKTEGEPLYITRKITGVGEVQGRGRQTEEGFVVLKGSVISPITDHTVSNKIGKRREEALAHCDKRGRIDRNYIFPSPSAAAVFVIGKSANGWAEWKNGDKKTLDELERK